MLLDFTKRFLLLAVLMNVAALQAACTDDGAEPTTPSTTSAFPDAPAVGTASGGADGTSTTGAGAGGSSGAGPGVRNGGATGDDTTPDGGTGGVTGASGEAGTEAGVADAGSGEPDTGTLPVPDDLEAMGPFAQTITDGTGPDGNYVLYHPEELGAEGVRHPVVLFAAGGGFPANYDTLLRFIASHGFVVMTFWITPQGTELNEGLDWLIEENAAESGMLAGKLDTDHVAAGGHSYGSLIAFNMATDPRITTTVHLQGGTLDEHVELANLREPALFICGQSPADGEDGTFTGDMANVNCEADFELATTPVFYGSLQGAAHIQLTEVVAADDPLKLQMIGAVIGWLRWRLAGDESQRTRYVGADCTLCDAATGWIVMQKGLE